MPGRSAKVAAALLLGLAVHGLAQEDVRVTVQKLVDGTVRGATLQAGLDEQRTKVETAWKKIFIDKPPPPAETEHLFVYGTIDKPLKDVGAGLEKHLALAQKVLALEGEELWPGKMTVILFNERKQYTSFVRSIEQRRVEDGEVGTFSLEGEWPYAAATGPLAKIDLSIENQAGEQVAAAVMNKKAGPKAPTWVYSAFGRATVVKSGTAAMQGIEHRRANQLLTKNKRTLKDLAAGLADDEATVLRANFLEYLAYSGRIGKFVPFVEGFRPREGVAEPTLESAFQAANIKMEQIDSTWQKWVKTLR
jgi:hypothetical protein